MLDVLIVDGDARSREALASWIGRQGMTCRTATGLADASAALARSAPDFALLDIDQLNGTGQQLLDVLRDMPDTDVVMMSGKSAGHEAGKARVPGVRHVLTKPVALPGLAAMLSDLTAGAARRRELQRMRDGLRDAARFGEIVGVSPAMRKVYAAIERVAPTDETVLISGPTGTGKELVASMVHRLSRRAAGPFVAVNCGAVPTNLIESELFGHERGAFTGADRQRKGVFEQSAGGTLFLDEITEMTPDMQVRLLRVLETGVLTRVGGSSSIKLDVRIIAATNRNPRAAVDAGVLRPDLLYRLYVVLLSLPPLEDRGGDVALLASSFLTPAAVQALVARHWPGNVRELRNAVRRAWIMSDEVIGAGDVADDAMQSPPATCAELVLRPGMRIRDVEQQLIEATLSHVNGNKHTASDLLGISVKTLYTRLSVYAAAR
jgi:DNA-binding NtrC family response regulator